MQAFRPKFIGAGHIETGQPESGPTLRRLNQHHRRASGMENHLQFQSTFGERCLEFALRAAHASPACRNRAVQSEELLPKGNGSLRNRPTVSSFRRVGQDALRLTQSRMPDDNFLDRSDLACDGLSSAIAAGAADRNGVRRVPFSWPWTTVYDGTPPIRLAPMSVVDNGKA
jgi:hypothetical protein